MEFEPTGKPACGLQKESVKYAACDAKSQVAKIWLTKLGPAMHVAVYEAKSTLSDLLVQACAGKEVVITRHGTPIAKLIAFNAPAGTDRARVARRIRALSKRLNIRAGVSLRKLIDEGRD